MKNVMLNESLKNRIGVHAHTQLTKGISLIVLIITIIIVIILAGSIILSLSDNNPIESANKAKFVSTMSAFQEELSMYHTNNYVNTAGQYDSYVLNADSKSITYTRKW